MPKIPGLQHIPSEEILAALKPLFKKIDESPIVVCSSNEASAQAALVRHLQNRSETPLIKISTCPTKTTCDPATLLKIERRVLGHHEPEYLGLRKFQTHFAAEFRTSNGILRQNLESVLTTLENRKANKQELSQYEIAKENLEAAEAGQPVHLLTTPLSQN